MIPTIKEQVELEKRMVSFGVHRHQHSVQSAEKGGRAADTQYAQRLIQGFLDAVAQSAREFNESKAPGKAAKYRVLLRQLPPDTIAFIGLRAVLNHFTKEEPLASLGIKIGTMLEDELKFNAFKQKEGNYYDSIIRDFQKKGTRSYRHMHRVLTMKANEHGVLWRSWETADKCAVGIKVVDLIIQSTDLINKVESTRKAGKRKHRPSVIIKPTEQCLEWIKRFTHYAEMLNPDRMPCIIQPDPWVSLTQGGYYTPQMRMRTPLVKTRSKKHQELLEKADLTQVMSAVNALQDTEWRVNSKVLAVLKTAWDKSLAIGLPSSSPIEMPACPLPKTKRKADMTPQERQKFEDWKNEARIIHTMEKERVSKCFQVIRVIRLATEFDKYSSIWFVHQTDFRGRVYCTVSGLSPQGADFGKALLQFSRPKPLGDKGEFWFKVHGANMYGKDKLSYTDRVRWVDESRDLICAIAAEPLSNRSSWSDCDKPWQFLAWCFEYAEYIKQGKTYESRLPVSLDGSCNGLQNFSAMLRDEVGGKATNLTTNTSPADIYSEVAQRATDKLKQIRTPESKEWLRLAQASGGVLPRSLAKRPVMTLPYGSTRQSCREYIYKFMVEEVPKFFRKEDMFRLSVFLTPILWESISEVVIAAREAMDWIQKCTSQLAKANHGVTWTPPNGFPVHQERKKVKSRQVHTELCGHFRLRLDKDTTKLDVAKQKQGASPNFVHSMDACHLMFTVNRAKEAGITHFACIHDDFGTHAADTARLHSCLRKGFLDLYQETDPIADFKFVNEELSGMTLPDPPARGNLDLTKITEAKYFFG